MEKEEKKQGEKLIIYVDEEIADLIPDFLENRNKDIKSISKALEEGDYETIRVLGHTMKGNGGGYGFDGISEIGASLEQAAKNKDPEDIVTLVRKLVDYLKQIEVVYE